MQRKKLRKTEAKRKESTEKESEWRLDGDSEMKDSDEQQ